MVWEPSLLYEYDSTHTHRMGKTTKNQPKGGHGKRLHFQV